MDFQDLYSFLTGWIKVLPSSVAQRIINQARESVYDDYDWSFLSGQEGYIRIPKRISNLGTISVTKYSKEILINPTLKAELDLLVDEDVQVENRQFRTISNDSKFDSIIYNIESYDSANSKIILSEPYFGKTNPISDYEIFKSYYYPPSITLSNGDEIFDIRNFQYVIDIFSNRRLYTDRTLDYITERDYSRKSRGNPLYIIPYKNDSLGNPLYELFPIPDFKEDRILKIIYRKNGQDFIEDSEILPKNIPTELILTKAKIKVYEWVEANKGIFPQELSKIGALSLINILSHPNNPEGYSAQLERAIKRDEELYPQALLREYEEIPFYDDYFRTGNSMWQKPPNETLIISF